MSSLTPAITDAVRQDLIDEGFRANALHDLRAQSFEKIVAYLQTLLASQSPSLLDVGSAHGWFLKAASSAGFQATGIEPDDRIAAIANQEGQETRVGFFPDVLASRETFDVVAFNDVFEHLPDVQAMMRAASERLNPSGVLLINIPCSNGPFYRLAELVARLGIMSPLDRMWQKGFASPHLSYFSPAQLTDLASQNALHLVGSHRVQSFAIKGLWSRLRYQTDSSLARNILIWIAVVIASPVLAAMPSDTNAFYFSRQAEAPK